MIIIMWILKQSSTIWRQLNIKCGRQAGIIEHFQYHRACRTEKIIIQERCNRLWLLSFANRKNYDCNGVIHLHNKLFSRTSWPDYFDSSMPIIRAATRRYGETRHMIGYINRLYWKFCAFLLSYFCDNTGKNSISWLFYALFANFMVDYFGFFFYAVISI